MKSIPDATAIVLDDGERAVLDGLVRSGRTEHRLRQRARMVPLAADGMATCSRAGACSQRTRSIWVRAKAGAKATTRTLPPSCRRQTSFAAADIVGLYGAPPENALVISIDEKPSIQALERKQGYLKMPNGRALTGKSHDYKRAGTTTLFAAFNVTTGKVTGRLARSRDGNTNADVGSSSSTS